MKKERIRSMKFLGANVEVYEYFYALSMSCNAKEYRYLKSKEENDLIYIVLRG